MLNLRKLIRGCAPAVCVLGLWQGAHAGEGTVGLRTFESPDGTTYGAISIRPAAGRAVTAPMSYVVLMDTSASQVGEHREQAFLVLEAFLKALPKQDRVAVVAVDVQTVAMTNGLQSPEVALEAALPALDARFPAGSSDLLAGIKAAQALLAQQQHAGIVYIGDGMSTANLVQVEELRAVTSELRDAQIAVHSFAVGSNTDLQLLGILGQETGGFVVRDEVSEQALTGTQAGQLLGRAAHEEVQYPSSVSLADAALLPNRPLPMRADRETVYLFQGDVTDGVALSVQERDAVHKYTVNTPTRGQGNTFLRQLYFNGQSTDGLALGLAGDWMVNLAHQTFEDYIAGLESQGQQALATGNVQLAEKIGFNLLEIDPNNARSRSLINAAAQAQILQVAQVESPASDAAAADPLAEPKAAAADPLAEPKATAADPLAEREAPVGASEIARYEAERAAKGQRLQSELEQHILRARQKFPVSPEGALAELEQARGQVKSATDIDPELQANLLRMINGEIQKTQSDKRQQESVIQQRQRRIAEREATQKLIDFQLDRDAQLEQMVNRIRALMEDGYHGNPNAFEQAEARAREVINEYPRSAIGTSEVFVTEAAGQLDKADRLRQLRSDRFLEVLYQVELSHVPFPDEPPIRYPSAEVWQALTEMRAQWKSVDLHQTNENERRIYDALKQTTSLEFPGNPLQDVIDYIASLHNIPIRLDEAALSAEGVAPDTEVRMVISGISLKSALKLLLEDVNGVPLTYVIEDEVMKITTQTKADEVLQTRVYPVADLVIPIQPLGGGFGSGGGLGGFGGGQQGGQGGFGGQQGGGFGGQGGGGFGGQGGGGGFFSVPAESDAQKKTTPLR
ncbi:MAG: VWA domain-containing protein [Planctomycetaceae bacterium]|nr:VWA domain-containing protein [Planctomycetaceae bacterium]